MTLKLPLGTSCNW